MYQSKYTSPLVKKIDSKMYGTGTGLIKKNVGINFGKQQGSC